jgi:hypothetical protein
MPNLAAIRNSDCNLVFGMLALQMNFVNRDELIRAMHAWVLDKQQSLGQILLREGHLTEKQHQALEFLLEQHLLLHDNDPEKSLQALAAQTPISPLPKNATLEDLEASLSLTPTAWQQAPPHPLRLAEPC